ncbi:MAG: hypothetical protein AAGD22_02505 [Verrucomicrobiota bacterium]
MGHHKDINELPPDGETFDITRIAKLNLLLFWVGLLALAGCVVAFVIPATRPSMSYSWLFGFVCFFTIALGGIFWTMLHHATNSGWGVAVRRMMENVGRMLPWVAIFFVPLFVPDVRESLWEWMSERKVMVEKARDYAASHMEEYTAKWQEDLDRAEAALAEVKQKAEAGMANASPGEKAFLEDKLAYEERRVADLKDSKPTAYSVEHHNMVVEQHKALLAHKAGYLNMGFWVFRMVVYFLALTWVIRTLRGWSVKQDIDGDWKYTRKARKWSCGFIPIFGVALTFAVIDWLMCLDYTWFSTMWGVYIFAGTAGASMAVIILLVTFVRSHGYLKDVVTDEHYHAMGKLMVAVVVFWGYIAFSQYFLYWYANITEETRFYLLRNTGGWWYMSLILVVGHFFVPFLGLLRRGAKKSPRVLCAFAVWVLVMHFIDMYWIVIPERGPSLDESFLIPGAFILDILAFIGIGAMVAYLFLRLLGKDSLYPCRDPRLDESVNLVN